MFGAGSNILSFIYLNVIVLCPAMKNTFKTSKNVFSSPLFLNPLLIRTLLVIFTPLLLVHVCLVCLHTIPSVPVTFGPLIATEPSMRCMLTSGTYTPTYPHVPLSSQCTSQEGTLYPSAFARPPSLPCSHRHPSPHLCVPFPSPLRSLSLFLTLPWSHPRNMSCMASLVGANSFNFVYLEIF